MAFILFAISAFIIATTEFIIVGLLPNLALALPVSGARPAKPQGGSPERLPRPSRTSIWALPVAAGVRAANHARYWLYVWRRCGAGRRRYRESRHRPAGVTGWSSGRPFLRGDLPAWHENPRALASASRSLLHRAGEQCMETPSDERMIEAGASYHPNQATVTLL